MQITGNYIRNGKPYKEAAENSNKEPVRNPMKKEFNNAWETAK